MEIIGRGTYGRVYKRTNPDGTSVAVKCMRDNSDVSGVLLEVFVKEIMCTKNLNHPNVIKYIGVECDDSSVSLIMPLARCDLHEWVMTGRYYSVVEFSRQIAVGLDYIHKNGVLHLDIRPANILVFDDGTLKITDFGISNLCDSPQYYEAYTLRFRPPEVILELPYTTKADMWAYGCTVYFLYKHDNFVVDTSLPLICIHNIIRSLGFPYTWKEFCNHHLSWTLSDIGHEPKLPSGDSATAKILRGTLVMDPKDRMSSDDVLSILGETPYTKVVRNYMSTASVDKQAKLDRLLSFVESDVTRARMLALDLLSEHNDVMVCALTGCIMDGKSPDFYNSNIPFSRILDVLR